MLYLIFPMYPHSYGDEQVEFQMLMGLVASYEYALRQCVYSTCTDKTK